MDGESVGDKLEVLLAQDGSDLGLKEKLANKKRKRERFVCTRFPRALRRFGDWKGHSVALEMCP